LYAVYNLNRGCHWDIKLASFSPPAGKNAETGFMRSPVCPIKKKTNRVARDKILIYIVKGNVSIIVAFKGKIRNFLNMVAVHIEGPRHPPICLFGTLVLGHCSFK
jgi:hypothetical protein